MEMCVDHDAQLPALPPGQFSARSERLTLEAADGNEFNALYAESDQYSGVSVIVLPDIRGLFKFYEDLAGRFAEEGHRAVATDYFGRTAGTGHRDSDFPFMDHVAQVNSDGFHADLAATVAFLREKDPDTRIFTVGFCFGGNMAWASATADHGVAGAVGFYGKPEADRPAGDGPIWDRCHLISCPVLSIFGGDDPGIPAENIDRLKDAMETEGVDYQTVTYAGAPHSFFDRTQDSHSDASLDSWNRITRFIAGQPEPVTAIFS